MVGRSNVGKSSLINALVRQRVARTSAAPGKTRLANVYRVRARRRPRPFYLVDLPGLRLRAGRRRGDAVDGVRRRLADGPYFGRRDGTDRGARCCSWTRGIPGLESDRGGLALAAATSARPRRSSRPRSTS